MQMQELQREQLFARRQKELAKLEKKLKDSLFEVERQERKLALKDEELQRRLHSAQKEIEEHKNEAMLVRTLHTPTTTVSSSV